MGIRPSPALPSDFGRLAQLVCWDVCRTVRLLSIIYCLFNKVDFDQSKYNR